MTDEEARLWTVLRHDFVEKFRRQEPMGPYIVDFVCYEYRLVVEVDGVQHADSDYDRQRDRYLRGLGFTVLRVWNGDVMHRLDQVADWVDDALDGEHRRATAVRTDRRRRRRATDDRSTPSGASSPP